MSRMTVRACLLSLFLPTVLLQNAFAGDPASLTQGRGKAPARLQHRSQARPIRYLKPGKNQNGKKRGQRTAAASPIQGRPVRAAYPQLNAPMYPVPKPNVPYQVGRTVITNQALEPHEMLYPHNYRAMYPPYYYRVKGGWIWTPFGMRSHENWELQGTTVEVKYRSHFGWFSGFIPPTSH